VDTVLDKMGERSVASVVRFWHTSSPCPMRGVIPLLRLETWLLSEETCELRVETWLVVDA
jgi:hypothetical protein